MEDRILKLLIPEQDEAGTPTQVVRPGLLACARPFELYGLRAHGESLHASDRSMDLH